MESNPTQQSPEQKNGKLWLIILALVILVFIVLFAMGGTTKAPSNQETGAVSTKQATSVDEVDNTASIEQQLKNIDIGDVGNDMKDINADVQSIQ
ncbi:MAG: hypothetical protein WC842_00490 [Candidatus Paceibacterota bacterium]|jgi:flagellar basal body-associated protein FliL